jgi:hypothetical protein
MSSTLDTTELTRRFNEDEAVWRCFQKKRQLRRFRDSPSSLSEKMLDYVDWLAAERECRKRRCIGRLVS